MAKGLIVYTTRSGNTKEIAQLISEGMRVAGAEVVVKNASEIKSEDDLKGYDAVLIGSPTYHGEMVKAAKTVLFLAEKAGLEGKVGGSFGAFGWSGEAVDRIFGTLQHVFNMDMVSGPLRLKSPSLGGGVQMAQDYGREVAAKMGV